MLKFDKKLEEYFENENIYEQFLTEKSKDISVQLMIKVDKILKNETISIHGDGEQKRCFISTEFVSEIIFTLFSISHLWDNELFYNVGFNDQSGLSVNDLYNTIKYTLLEIHCIKSIDNLKSPIFSEDRPYNDKIYKIKKRCYK